MVSVAWSSTTWPSQRTVYRWLLKLDIYNPTDQTRQAQGKSQQTHIGLPYVWGLSERLHRTFHSHGVTIYHKPYGSLRSKLTSVEDHTPLDKRKVVNTKVPHKMWGLWKPLVGGNGTPVELPMQEHMICSASAVYEYCKAYGQLRPVSTQVREPRRQVLS